MARCVVLALLLGFFGSFEEPLKIRKSCSFSFLVKQIINFGNHIDEVASSLFDDDPPLLSCAVSDDDTTSLTLLLLSPSFIAIQVPENS
ncbi:unnamed protein product [Sphenostylis stenocarpa]|uniref:Uncharacterized protein n=1 Tax=Sphenostylis stenocarpa TaxID=92480 RepID=A0AA86TMB0_9FABA|nr:unnamed protein product [Sphenostylis stenocarpa]